MDSDLATKGLECFNVRQIRVAESVSGEDHARSSKRPYSFRAGRLRSRAGGGGVDMTATVVVDRIITMWSKATHPRCWVTPGTS